MRRRPRWALGVLAALLAPPAASEPFRLLRRPRPVRRVAVVTVLGDCYDGGTVNLAPVATSCACGCRPAPRVRLERSRVADGAACA